MKFLRLCLWLLMAAFSAGPIFAQQTLTPQQKKEAADALRKALDQPPAAAPAVLPAETLPAKPVASPVVKAPVVSAPPPAPAAPAAPVAPTLPADQSAAAREALRRALDQPPTTAPAAAPVVTAPVVTAPVLPAETKTVGQPNAKVETEQKRLADEEKRMIEQQKQYEAKRKAEQQNAVAKPVAAAPVAAVPATSEVPALSPEQSAAAREAVRRALDQAAGSTPSSPAPKVSATSEVKAPAPSSTPSETKAPDVMVEELPALSPKEAAAARAAVRLKMDQVQGDGLPNLPAVPAVQSSLPQSKAERLAELLAKYRADQITPAEYHSQRAKILAEPNQ